MIHFDLRDAKLQDKEFGHQLALKWFLSGNWLYNYSLFRASHLMQSMIKEEVFVFSDLLFPGLKTE